MLEFFHPPNINQQSELMQGHPENISTTLSCHERTGLGAVKCEKTYELCEGCGQKIHDRYLMRVGDASWHEQCLSCCVCGVPLDHSCYVRNSKLYCKTDYDRMFSIKCLRCGDRVQPNDMVMRAQNYVFHLTCFVCCVCCQPLQKGEQFILRGGQLFCRHDFEKDLYLSQHQCPDDEFLMDEMRPRDGRRGPKRPRTILTSSQRRQFKASFEMSPKPCRKIREALAKDTGLSVRVVQVWFQNQRAKMKKIQRKSKQDGDKTSDKDSSKDDKDYLGNSNDSFCSSDISLDGSNFDNLDEATSDTLSLQNLDLHATHIHTNLLDGTATASNTSNIGNVNPIDKLYLMQNSYFNSEQ
ncbi:LIM homeobox transcription factor 1-beta.1 [Sitodiplosis mosellana]|uniref:LIM homeobox transcription factor 1-beta.1 n=1 Tax=Sitodiplosis mosellana TaxID=263140 RepID=UPI002443E723|nr:LIM homeobox transcription factor 1-beta.1 [Sitodiplosis mosellana]